MSDQPAQSRTMTLANAIQATLERALNDDATVILIGETVGRLGGHGGTTLGLQARFAERVRDLPIADRGTLGLAVGMALGGQRPVVALSGTARLPHVLGPLSDAAAIAARGGFAVPVVVRVPYGDQAPGIDVPAGRFLAQLPGLRVVCPADAQTGAGVLRWALQQPGPTVILEPRARLDARGPVDLEAVVAPRGQLLRQGAHVTVATWGAGVPAALQAADGLAREGIAADVLDLVSLAPIDAEALGERVRATGRLVVVHPSDPELAAQVRQQGLEEAFLYLEAPLADAPAVADQVAAAVRTAVTY